jgi:outer membrane immunogenic protein
VKRALRVAAMVATTTILRFVIDRCAPNWGHDMKRMLLVGAAISVAGSLCLLALAAQTADVPVTKVPSAPTVQAARNWTGFYAGVHGGYGRGHADWAVTGDGFGFLDPLGLPVDIKGGLFGVQTGYNWQNGTWVYGVEADYSASRLKGFSFTGPDEDGYRNELKSFGTIRGRLGVGAGSTLWYVSAGAGYGHIKNTVGDIQDDLSFQSDLAVSNSKVKWGPAAAAGIEWAFAGNWIVRAEYLYIDLGKISFRGVAPNTGDPVLAKIDTAFHVARAALSFRW